MVAWKTTQRQDVGGIVITETSERANRKARVVTTPISCMVTLYEGDKVVDAFPVARMAGLAVGRSWVESGWY